MSEQGLTERDFRILGAAFEPSEIGVKGQYKYIKRSAIMRRLRLVDPNYTMRNDTYVQVNGDVVTVWGELTIKGVPHHDSCSKNVECWRKVDDKDPSKGYKRIEDYEYSREFANAVMKAQTGLLHRCATRFGLGVYLIEKAAAPTLASIIGEQQKLPSPQPSGQQPTTTPPATPGAPTQPEPEPGREPQKWALNGDGKKFEARMIQLDLTWTGDVKMNLEQGKVLEKLSDTTLSFQVAYHRLDEIKSAKVAAELEAKRAAQSASQKGDEPISVSGDQLQVGDLVYGLGGSKPKRLICNLGNTEDGAFTYWAVWANTDFNDSLTRMLFEKALKFKVLRGEPVVPPDKILRELEVMKHEQLALREAAETTT